jgi:hypothetical protein
MVEDIKYKQERLMEETSSRMYRIEKRIRRYKLSIEIVG